MRSKNSKKPQTTTESSEKKLADRTADADLLDFAALPVIGLIAVARTAAEGNQKYGRWNYLRGLKTHDCLNHAIRHIYMYLSGDNSEPHLPHAAWNLLAAIQSEQLDPGLNEKDQLFKGCNLGYHASAHLNKVQAEIKENMTEEQRAKLSDWSVGQIEEVRTICDGRFPF